MIIWPLFIKPLQSYYKKCKYASYLSENLFLGKWNIKKDHRGIVHETGIALGSSNGNCLKMNTYLSEEQMKGDQIVIDAMGKNNFQQIQEQAHDILLKERMGKQSGLVSVHGKKWNNRVNMWL